LAALAGGAWLSGLVGCSGETSPAADGTVEVPAPVPAPAADERPNVLLIVWDTVRADRMSLYGHRRPTTPKLDAWAKEAVVFERATAPGMWTLPSHASMFTGLRQTEHGAKPSWRWLDQRFDTLAELLDGAGYDTFAFSSNLIASPMTNLTQGFETIETTYKREGVGKPRYMRAAREATAAKLIPGDASTEISPGFTGSTDDKWAKAAFKDAAPVLHRGLLEWLDERGSEAPWFAYLNMMEAHTPRVPTMSARKRVLSEEQIRLGLMTDASLFAENEYIVGKRDYTPEQLEAIGGVYDAALVDLDDATADLFADLEQLGVLDDTLVILVADHGEALGEHRRFEHRWSVYEQLLSVPLVVRFPASTPAPVAEPRRVQQRVSTADVFATVLDVTGTEPKRPVPTSTSLATRLSSQTFAPRIFTQMLDPFATQLKSMSEAYPDLDLSPWTRSYCAVYEGSKKLIHASDAAHELYDVHADPGELTNLYQAEVATAEQLTEALRTWESGLSLYDPAQRAATDGAKGQKSNRQGLTREECQQLVMLGYMDNMEDCLSGGGDGAPDLARDRCTAAAPSEAAPQ
jgi:arylsulfatase A-like enzyme